MNGIVNGNNVRQTNKECVATEEQQQVDCCYDGDDLIDAESGDPEKDRAVWTETALDILIAIYNDLQNSSPHLQFRTKRETYNYIENKMTRRGYTFTWNQIENKLKALKRIYLRRKKLNQEIEPELSNMFEENEENDENDWETESSEPTQKKVKYNADADADTAESPDRDRVPSTKVGWNKDATKVLMSLVPEVKPLVGTSPGIKNKREMWEHISTEMAKLNHNFTPTQIGNKWKSLCRSDRKKNERDEFYNNDVFFNNDVNDGTGTDDSLLADDPNNEDCIDDTKNNVNSDVKNDETSDVKNDENSDVVTPNDIKVAPNEPNSSNVQTLAQSCMEITNSFAQIQAESNKIAAQKINLKQKQIQAYKERTKEIKEIGSHLSQLVKHFMRRDNF